VVVEVRVILDPVVMVVRVVVVVELLITQQILHYWVQMTLMV
jgi:hypothetical protein